jgi:hypothetical protein
MELIENNPYRILGLLANSSEREIQNRKSLIIKNLSIGRSYDSDYNFSFLTPIQLTEPTIIQASTKIEINQDKINNSLFWFIEVNNFDGTALNYLKNGDKNKAIEIWTKVTSGKEISSKNFSYFNNIGTLKLLSNTIDEIKEGLEFKIKLIESENFIDFVKNVGDAQTYTFTNQQQLEKFLDDILIGLLPRFDRVQIATLFNNSSENVITYINKKFTEGPLHEIQILIEDTKSKRKNSPKDGYLYGKDLLNKSREDLNLIHNLLGQNNLQYRMISDNVAKEIIQCGIDSYSKGDKSDLSIKKSIELLKSAKQIAKTSVTIERIDSNLKELDDLKYSDILFALEILKRLKEIIIDTNRDYTKQLNIFKVDEFLRKEITNSVLQKIASTDRSEYITNFIELADYIRKNGASLEIFVIINKFVAHLPNTHPFVIAEEKRKQDEELKRKQKEEERKKKEAQNLKLIAVLAIILLIVGSIWGIGWAVALFIIGLLIWGNTNS